MLEISSQAPASFSRDPPPLPEQKFSFKADLGLQNILCFLKTNSCLFFFKSFPQYGSFFSSPVVAQMAKCLPAMQETQLLSLAREDPLEKEMATHSGILAWKIPWMKPGKLQSMESQRIRHD